MRRTLETFTRDFCGRAHTRFGGTVPKERLTEALRIAGADGSSVERIRADTVECEFC